MMKRSVRLALTVWAMAATAWSQAVERSVPVAVEDERSICATRTDTAPRIDGKLDDPCWARAGRTSTFFNERSFEPCAEQTVVYAAYDMENLYIGFECLESEMSSLRAYERREDRYHIMRDDYVEVMLDTFLDRRSYYQFTTNAVGTRYDARQGVDPGRGAGIGWDCNWEVATSLADDRWFVEMSIPLSELLFERKDSQTWGVNFQREEHRLLEEGMWSLRKDDPSHPRNFGRIEGLDLADAVPRRRFWTSPYISGIYESNSADEFDAHVGLDVTYKPSTDLTAAFTVNPDFGQVETDADDIVLRDVERFLPERRPYFEEGMELFDTPLSNLFYSRRIFDIDYGAKVSGKLGPYSLALLDTEGRIVRGGEHKSGNFLTMRGMRDIGSDSSVGMLATNSERDDGYNRLVAFDTRLRLPYDLDISSQYAMSWRGRDEDESLNGTQDAFVADISHGQEPFWLGVGYRDIGEEFRPDLSYVSRKNVKGPSVWMRFSDDREGAWYHRMRGNCSAELFENHDGRTVLRDYYLSGEVTLHNGLGFGVRGKNDFHDPYDNYELGASIEINALDRWRAAELYVATGEFEDTPYERIEIEKRFALVDNFTLEFEGEIRQDDLEDGRNTVWLARAVGNYSIADDAWLKGVVQFSDESQHNVNIIFKWEFIDRIEWYLVYNDVKTADEPQFHTAFTKLVYNF